MKLKFTHLLLAFTLVVTLASGILIENVHAGQPHMANALDNLREARHQLEIAKHDKGGHRERAIEIIDSAIAEIKLGMDDAGE